MANLDDMSLDKFRLWTSNALRVFLSLRKKPISGDFDDLVARAFCAWEENIAVDTNEEHRQRQLLLEYQGKLSINGEKIPDPCSIKSGWLSEVECMNCWPSVYITDISSYLTSHNPDNLMKKLLNEYKEGKAYRYFTGDWVKEVNYHGLDDSDKCIMKARVMPSQAVRNKPYEAWIVIRKDSKSYSGGEILKAYCTCTAGMLGSCNHIAGILFRIENAVKAGITKVSSTSKKSVWNIPRTKTQIVSKRASSLLWTKSKFARVTDQTKEKQKSVKRLQFTPLNKNQQVEYKDPDSIRQTVYGLIKDDLPDSCFVLLMEKRKMKTDNLETLKLPLTLKQVADEVKSSSKSPSKRKSDLISQVKLSSEEIEALSCATVEQSMTDTWKEHRQGRVTASNFHRINCRAKSLKEDPEADPSSVISSVMGTANRIETKAMKHGISLEPYANAAFTGCAKKNHKHFKAEGTGMIVSKNNPCLSASPDLLVECSCCGKGLCEIKCPESIKDQAPTSENVPYVYLVNGELKLKKKHPYYYQVQGQMGICGRNYCDFFIYTLHGYLCIRIKFDQQFYNELVENLVWFWDRFIVKELLKENRVVLEEISNK